MRILKSLFALAGAAVLLLAACTTKEQEIAVTGVSLTPSTLSIQVGETQSLTAEVQPSNASNKKVSWSTNDPDMNIIVLSDGKVKGIAAGKATVTVTTDDGNFTATCAVTVTKAGEPGPDGKINVTSITLAVTGGNTLAVGGSAVVKATLEPSNTTEADKVVWTSSDKKVATVEGSGTEATITAVGAGTATISASVDGKTAEVEITVEEPGTPVKSIKMDPESATLGIDQEERFHAVIDPADATNVNNVEWKAEPSSLVKLTPSGGYCKVKALAAGTVTLTASVEGKKAKATITIKEKLVEVEGTVDLGLPSGTLWCTRNLGTDSSHPRGQYYAWGETEPKSDYSGSTYKFGNLQEWGDGGTDEMLSKYNEDDNLGFLEAEDDAATVILGEGFRTPTLGEWAELWNPANCQWEWTTQDGMHGVIFTSKRNGKSLFLPATGYYYYDELASMDNCLYYWSSTFDRDLGYYSTNSYECYFYIDSDKPYYGIDATGQYYGQSIRPVYGPRPTPSTGITVTSKTKEVEAGKTYTLTASVQPASAPQTVVWESDAENVEVNYWTGEVKLLYGMGAEVYAIDGTGGRVATVTISVKPVYSEPEAVDMGLSVKWASWNLGASKVGEPGYHFAWGETEPKATFTYENHKWYNEETGILAPYTDDYMAAKDDAAAVHLGGKWRVPTMAQWEELVTKCTWEKLDKDDPNNTYGISVLRIKGLKAADGNRYYLYLPLAGWGGEDGIASYDYGGAYQSNELVHDDHSCNHYFWYSEESSGLDYSTLLQYGMSIRPVWDEYRSKAAEVRSLGPVSYRGNVSARPGNLRGDRTRPHADPKKRNFR